jgi:hypothetical protein
LDVADLNNWLAEPLPVLLIFYEAAKRSAYWLYLQRDVRDMAATRTGSKRATATVHFPAANRLNRKTLAFARRWKNNILSDQIGSIDHG